MLRDWLLNISVTFGLGLLLGLVFNAGNPLLSGLQAAMAAAAGTAIITRNKKSRFQKTSASLRSQISRLQAKSHALQHNILTAATEQAQVVTELDSYYQRRQAAEQHISALETARKRMATESQQVQDQLTSLQEERTSLEQSIAKIAINRQQLLGGKLELTSQISNSKQQLAQEEQELSAAVSQLKLEQEQYLQAAQQVTEKLATLQTKQLNLEESIAKIEIDRQHLLDGKIELQSQLSTSKQQLAAEEQELRIAVAQLQSEQEQRLTEAQQVQRKLALLEEEQFTLEQGIAQIALDRQQLLEGDRQLQSDLSQANQQLEQEKQELNVTITQLKADQARYAAELGLFQEEQAHLEQSVAQLNSDRQQLIDLNLELQAQQNQSQQQLILEKQELSELLAQLEIEKMHRISTSQQLTADIAGLTAHKQELQTELGQLQQQLATTKILTTEFLAIPTDAWAELPSNSPPIINSDNWQDRFEDLDVRSVFVQLQEYGSVTEAELTQMLEGNPRKARQFALKFEEYLQLVPFKARVEVAASGKRYVRE
jgi:predicted  nucleic acid-binding Zn-ribbon protein